MPPKKKKTRKSPSKGKKRRTAKKSADANVTPTSPLRRIRKRGEFISFVIAALLIVGFFAASHFMFFEYTERRIASIQVPSDMKCGELVPYLNHEDTNLRFRASVALASCGYPQAVDGLIAFLENSDPNLRKAAAFTLLSTELTFQDPAVVAKIEANQDKISSLVHNK